MLRFIQSAVKIDGEKAKQVYALWNTTVKLAWGCPQNTRTYILQPMLSCGYQSWYSDQVTNSLKKSASREVQVLSGLLARDIRSMTGRNLQLIADVSGLSPWTASAARLRDRLIASEVVEVPPMDRWRLPYLGSLLSQRRAEHDLALELQCVHLELIFSFWFIGPLKCDICNWKYMFGVLRVLKFDLEHFKLS